MTNPANPCGRAWRETEHYKKFGAVHAPRIRGAPSGRAAAPQRAGGASRTAGAQPANRGGRDMKVELAPELVEAAIELARRATGKTVTPAAAVEGLIRAHCTEIAQLQAAGERARAGPVH